MNFVTKVAIVVIVAAIVIGSAFGLIATSTTAKNHSISINGDVILTQAAVSCPNMPSNFTEWVQLQVYANQTDLKLISLTVFSPLPSTTLTVPLNSSEWVYVLYHSYNTTYETINVPIVNYWPRGSDVYLSVNYYFGGPNPTTPTELNIGSRPVNNGTISC